ncbi:MAG: phosphatidylglycerophosphatase A [Candidatus Zixiibacteriota bacterium]
MMNRLIIFIATGFYSGYGRPFSGTWGTIPAWLIAFFLIKGNQPILLTVTIAVFFISVWSSKTAEELFSHDDKRIVIDEWLGMFVTLLLIPPSLTNYIIAFIAFRAFDVVKIPPAAQCEKLPHGWGITMDDLFAGIYANIFTQIIIRVMNSYSGNNL